MILRTNHNDNEYVWIEKGQSACLRKGDILLWWGTPKDPMKQIDVRIVPLLVLLELSVLRDRFLKEESTVSA